MEVLFIVGLPGSGKTHLANRINRDNNNRYTIVDDPTNFNTQIVPLLNDGRDIIITDPHLCVDKNRESAKNKVHSINDKYKIEWIFFENDPIKCLRNIEHRSDGRKVKNYINQLSKSYIIPDNSTIIEIWEP